MVIGLHPLSWCGVGGAIASGDRLGVSLAPTVELDRARAVAAAADAVDAREQRFDAIGHIGADLCLRLAL
ncbi:hypothetical protein [Lacipirellula sp.]|uniref:hypothetical protein n=1 Tax=Lacipirellula sp. TaxID=2691419 RepID=UPI003D0D7516